MYDEFDYYPDDSVYSISDPPLLWALDANGNIRHVDDVTRGLACGCTCPNSDCGARLIARQGDVMRHSFAHESGMSCGWSFEAALSKRVAVWLFRVGFFSFPHVLCPVIPAWAFNFENVDARGLSRDDVLYDREPFEMELGFVAKVANISEQRLSGRVVPDIVADVIGASGMQKVGFIVALSHAPTKSQIQALGEHVAGVVVIDFRVVFNTLKEGVRAQAGKHFDREEILLECQSDETLKDVLFYEDNAVKRWACLDAVSYKMAEDEARWDKGWAAYCSHKEARAEIAFNEALYRQEEDTRFDKYDAYMLALSVRDRAERERLRKFIEEREEAERRRAEEVAHVEAERARQERIAEFERKRAEMRAKEPERLARELEQQEVRVFDMFGNRIIKCTECGVVDVVEKFAMYGGPGTVNQGVCVTCMRRREVR